MDSESVVEIEWKFDVDDDVAPPVLTNLPGVEDVDEPVEYRLEAEYFDTEDFQLASEKITLRRRTGGEDAGWHLKLPAGADERHEYHAPLRRTSDGVPSALVQRIRVHIRDRALVPVARLSTHRTVYRLRGDTGDIIADFIDDHVDAKSFGPEAIAQSWREWEVELGGAPRTFLEASQSALLAAGASPSAYGSKLARALGAHLHLVPEKDSPTTSTGRAGDIVIAYLDEQLSMIKEQDPRVRQDGPDAVHRMRVATRRLRSILATYGSLMKDTDTVRLLRGELKWLAGVLGAARDAEVMHERLKAMIANEPVELLLGPVERRIDLELGGGYKKAHAQVVKTLNGKRYFRLLDLLETFNNASTFSTRGAKAAQKVIPERINRDIKRLRCSVDDARKHPAGIGDHPALHEARKAAKRLRYAAEAASPLNRKKISRLAEAAQGIQKILGDHQDTIVTRALLRGLGTGAPAQAENGFSYGRLHALEQSAALEAETQFHRQWRHFPTY